MNKLIYTKIFLSQLNKSISDATVKEYMFLWWQNTRSKGAGGLRLSEQGFDLLTELDITVYEIPYPQDMVLTAQIIIFLDQFITCPYYLTNKSIHVTNEKKAVELTLFSGDLRKYGIAKALSRNKKVDE